MRHFTLTILALVAFATCALAGERATASAWLDTFGGPAGAVVYPQVSWSVPTAIGPCYGYSFWESAAREKFFNNNLVDCSPAFTPWFAVHVEVGDVPFHGKGFVQVGPRVNLHKAIPRANRLFAFAWASYLPALKGIRTDNVVVAAASQQFPVIGKRFTAHMEAFDRKFEGWSYGEAWFVGRVNGYKRIEPVAHVIRDSSSHPKYTVAAGIRVHLF